jgi:stage II sporulation protein D
VHCQAFNGKSRMNPMIYRAVNETRDEILVDQEGKAIFTAFHANCGGITSSASMSWNRDLPYLISVHDPFCDASSNRDWNKKISRQEWDAYLKRKGLSADADTYRVLSEPGRQKYFLAGEQKLTLSTIREDLNLRSSFFSMTLTLETVTIQGHGYGHGVGMCQEGAMEMARVGYGYLDILMFYFYHVKLEKR